jgi:hypothetical protein
MVCDRCLCVPDEENGLGEWLRWMICEECRRELERGEPWEVLDGEHTA